MEKNIHAMLLALAEPNRQAIVELLRQGPTPVGAIADNLQLQQSQTSKHLRHLNEAGLVVAENDANRRIYRLREESLEQLEQWIGFLKQGMREEPHRLHDYVRFIAENDRPTGR